MDNAKITYFIKDLNKNYIQAEQAYVGTYTGEKALSFDLRIWNNYKGIDNVKDLNNFNIVLSFSCKEDSALLPYIKMAIANKTEIPVSIIGESAVGTFLEKVILSGTANDGADTNSDNFIDITISFNAEDSSVLKDHDLKSMYIELVEL